MATVAEPGPALGPWDGLGVESSVGSGASLGFVPLMWWRVFEHGDISRACERSEG